MIGSFAADTTGVAVASLALAGEKSASTFVSVTTGPELSSFKLDLSTDQLLLTFSETVKQTLVRLLATPSCRSEARRFLSGGGSRRHWCCCGHPGVGRERRLCAAVFGRVLARHGPAGCSDQLQRAGERGLV